MSYYKQLRDDEGFIIVRHIAGAVCYQTTSMSLPRLALVLVLP
jgi:hypothetical protein